MTNGALHDFLPNVNISGSFKVVLHQTFNCVFAAVGDIWISLYFAYHLLILSEFSLFMETSHDHVRNIICGSV